jgi:hypothetical protein
MWHLILFIILFLYVVFLYNLTEIIIPCIGTGITLVILQNKSYFGGPPQVG